MSGLENSIFQRTTPNTRRHDRALDYLERWVGRGSINYPMLAHGDPLLEPLRGEPRFQRLLDRVRPEWERFVPRFKPSA